MQNNNNFSYTQTATSIIQSSTKVIRDLRAKLAASQDAVGLERGRVADLGLRLASAERGLEHERDLSAQLAAEVEILRTHRLQATAAALLALSAAAPPPPSTSWSPPRCSRWNPWLRLRPTLRRIGDR